MTYRPDIDGLRAVAVLSVFLFHAGVAGFESGALGVDIFFVISGYLITRVICERVTAGNFSVVGFFERRFRRLYPAIIFCLMATNLIGAEVLTSTALVELFGANTSVVLFFANIHFLNKVDYFATPTALEPLIHFWSLAVEEQFYFVFPFLLLMSFRLNRFLQFTLFFLLFSASAAFAVYLTSENPAGSFYLLPTRAWELLVGVSIGLLHQWHEKPSPSFERHLVLREVPPMVGLLLIGMSIFNGGEYAAFPNWNVTIAVLGSGLVILWRTQSSVSKLLSIRPLVWLGLVSFGFYLWHQPLLVFTRVRLNTLELTPAAAAAVFAATLLASVLSFIVVERPIRRLHVLKGKSSFSAFVAITGLLVLASTEYAKTLDWTQSKQVAAKTWDGQAMEGVTVHSFEDANKILSFDFEKKNQKGYAIKNQVYIPDGEVRNKPILFVGDSHAWTLKGLAFRIAKEQQRQVHLLSATGCLPLFDYHKIQYLHQTEIPAVQLFCKEVGETWKSYILSRPNQYAKIVLAARWNWLVNPEEYGRVKVRPTAVASNEDYSVPKTLAERKHMLAEGLSHTLEELAEINAETIIMGQAPLLTFFATRCDFDAKPGCAIPNFSDAYARKRNFDEVVERVFQTTTSEVVLFDTFKFFCSEMFESCKIRDGQRLYYSDDDHISLFGNDVIFDDFSKMVD